MQKMKLTPLCIKMKDISKVATPVWVKDNIYKVSRDTDSTIVIKKDSRIQWAPKKISWI